MDESGNIFSYVLILIVLVCFSMIFSATESAFLSLNKLRIRFLKEKKDRKALKVAHLLDNKTQLINTILVANNIVNIAISSLLTYLAMKFFGPSGVGIATLIATIVLLIFGEITPKNIGVSKPEPIAFFFSSFINFFVIIFHPFVSVLTSFAHLVSRLIGIPVENKKQNITEDEIKNLLEIGEEEGVVDSGERKMLNRVFKFKDLDAKSIMTPRTEIVSIQMDTNLDDILKISKESHFSRFPVYKKDIDDIKGIIYIKDVLSFVFDKSSFDIAKILREPLFVSETRHMSAIRQFLCESHQNMCIVLDEYSGTAGLITMEDVNEEIFGAIIDEHDVQNPLVNQPVENNFLDGDMRLIDLNEQYGLSLTSEFYDTIAGFVTEKIGDIPTVGACVTEGNTVFVVKEVQNKRITKIEMKIINNEIN